MLKKPELTIYLTNNCNLTCKHCLPKGSLILTDEGLIEIEKAISLVRAGKKLQVISHKGKWQKIIDVFEHNYDDDLISIKPYSLPLFKLTKGHKVFVATENGLEKIEVEKLNKEHLLWIPKQNQITKSNDAIDLLSFVPEGIITSKKLRKVDLNKFTKLIKENMTSERIGEQLGIHPTYVRKLKQEVIKGRLKKCILIVEKDGKIRYMGGRREINRCVDQNKLAKLLGYYCAEGCAEISKNRPNSGVVRFTLGHHETEYIEEIKDLIERTFGITPATHKTKTSTHIVITNAILARFFIETCGENCYKKTVPTFLFNSATEKNIINFLAGYINGDGSRFDARLNTDRTISFASASDKLAMGVAILFWRVGYIFSYHLVHPKGTIDGRELHGGIAHLFQIHSNKAKELENKLFGDTNSIGNKRNGAVIEKEDGWLVKIWEITSEKYSGMVYNITVENDESYTAPFIAIGNCYNGRSEGNRELSIDDLNWLLENIDNKRTTFLGGEPMLYPHLEEAINAFPMVTVSTNGMLITEENVHILKKATGVQCSVEIGRGETNYIRGENVWETVMAAGELLHSEGIEHYFRASFWEGNLPYLKEFIEMDAPLALFPRLDKPPLPPNLTSKLFEEVLKHENWILALPNFLQYLRKPGRCKAGTERLNVYYDKKITPCNF
ncbi:MAG: hypothetical protein NT038_09185, partial [Euryarchaeota archaeon]|nr:hypothetical protein [Euryarchaeota archaeon]